MRRFQIYSVIALASALAACSNEAVSNEVGLVSDFSDAFLSDCVTASNTFQQEAKLSEELITDSKSRRIDFLLRDEFLRRLSASEDRSEFYPAASRSDFAKKMLGDLNDFDYVEVSKVQLSRCDGLIKVLEARLLSEVSV